MKRLVCAVLLIVMMLSLVACGSGAPREIDIKSVKEQIISELSIEGALDLASDRLLALYGIEEAEVLESACFVTMGGVFPDEIVMIKAVDEDAADRIESKLNTRLDEIKVQSQSYDPENYAIAQQCKVLREGTVVALFMSAKYADMEAIFNR